jgi:hypothetical protein
MQNKCALTSELINLYELLKGYSNEIKRECLKVYVNGTLFGDIYHGLKVCITPPEFIES